MRLSWATATGLISSFAIGVFVPLRLLDDDVELLNVSRYAVSRHEAAGIFGEPVPSHDGRQGRVLL